MWTLRHALTSECCAAWLQDLQCAKYNRRLTGNLERCSHGRLRTVQVANSGHGGETSGGYSASAGGSAGYNGDSRQGARNGWAAGLQRAPHAVLGVSSNATRPEIRQVGTHHSVPTACPGFEPYPSHRAAFSSDCGDTGFRSPLCGVAFSACVNTNASCKCAGGGASCGCAGAVHHVSVHGAARVRRRTGRVSGSCTPTLRGRAPRRPWWRSIWRTTCSPRRALPSGGRCWIASAMTWSPSSGAAVQLVPFVYISLARRTLHVTSLKELL